MRSSRKRLCAALAALFVMNILIISFAQRADAVTYKQGSTGSVVTQIQTKLRNWGYYSGSVDGIYGSKTVSAVKYFQRSNGLTADGKAGSKTLEKLNSRNALAKGQTRATATPKPTAKATAKATATSKPTARPTATPNLSRDYYLQAGSSGAKVKTLQNRLIELGYLAGKATGIYSGATEAAVIAFQKKTKGLWADGVAGPETLRALYSDSAAKASGLAASTGETLELGSEGQAVRTLQQRLKDLGYDPGAVDGSFGEGTRAAVLAFQQRNGLTADGKAGTATLDRLYSADAVSSSGGDALAVSYATLRQGDSGDAVKNLQRALKELGYYSGSIDGVYGESTTGAVAAFQTRNYLTPVDGVAGSKTLSRLYSSDAVPENPADYDSLRLGDSGDVVTEMQECLVQMGYLTRVTGVYDEATESAVRELQADQGLVVDGIAGGKTLTVIFGY